MKILVIGAGAIGSYVGGSLALAGEKVIFLEKPEIANIQPHRQVSIQQDSQMKTTTIPLVGSLMNSAAAEKLDLIIMAVKSFDTGSVITKLKDELEEIPPILCLQNGVENELLLRDTFGADKVIHGSVTTAIGKGANSEVIVERLRGIGIAAHHTLSSLIVESMNAAGLQAKLIDSADGMKWSKMLTNLIANASSAILDMTPAEIFANKSLYEIEIKQLRETLSVMRAIHTPVVDLPGTPVRLLAAGVERLPLWLSQPLLSKFVGKGRGKKMPSFHIDLHAGYKQSEVEYLNGAVNRAGEKMGINTPANAFLTQTLLGMVEGRIDRGTYRGQPEKFANDFTAFLLKQ